MKNLKEKIKNYDKGITLIALVVTIIVLLILAGVAIVTLTGDNGIINRASGARKTNIQSELQEAADLAYQSAIIDKLSTGKQENLLKKVAEEMQKAGYEIKSETIGVRLLELGTNDAESELTNNSAINLNTGDTAKRFKVNLLTSNKEYYVKKDGLYHQITISSDKAVVSNEGKTSTEHSEAEDTITLTISPGLVGLVKVGNDTLSSTTATVSDEDIITVTPGENGVSNASVSVKLNDDVVNEFNVGITITKVQTVEDIFDSTGDVADKLHIGDFVDYTAGSWDTDSWGKIASTANKPTTAFTFGGFASNASRDGNALPYDNKFTYVKDSDDNPITGWRVFDVDTANNKIILISAGCPEDYYHPYVSGMGYNSQYILSGDETGVSATINSSCTPRDWSMYESGKGAVKDSATALTKTQLDAWYSKYIVKEADTYTEATFQNIYNNNFKKYQTLIDNYSYYWLASTRSSNGRDLYYVYPGGKYVSYGSNIAYGVRVLVSISGVQLEKSNTTKKLKDPRNTKVYEYGYWTIQ